MLITLIANALAFYVTAYIVPGVTIDNFGSLLVVSIVWGLLSLIIKPILLILTLPVNILTLGLFTFVINAFLIMLMSGIVPGFGVDSFGAALLAAIVLSLVNLVLGNIV